MGIKNGLTAIDAKLREPVADRLFLSTADGGRFVNDALRVNKQNLSGAPPKIFFGGPTRLPRKQGLRRPKAGAGSFKTVGGGPCLCVKAWNPELDYNQGTPR
jgi:hypothetical protein